MRDSDRNYLQNLYALTHYPIYVFHQNALVFSSASEDPSDWHTLENPFQSDPVLLESLLSFSLESGFVIREEEQLDIFYGISHLSLAEVCITGPFSLQKLNFSQIYRYMKQHHLKDYKNYMIRTATESEVSALHTLISLYFYNDVFPTYTSEKEITLSHTESFSAFEIQDYHLTNGEADQPHFPYKGEQELMEHIRNANLDGIPLVSFQLPGYSIGIDNLSMSKQNEYSAVIAVSLFARAAIEGGLNPYIAYELNDLYLKRISEITKQEDYLEITKESICRYIKTMQTTSAIQATSVAVEKAKHFISQHLHQPFTLQNLADYVGLSPNYLSALFSREEKKTIKSYTRAERIAAAKNMLKFSDCSVSSISDYLCFPSQSHFAAVFRKETGKTPSEYRRLNKAKGF